MGPNRSEERPKSKRGEKKPVSASGIEELSWSQDFDMNSALEIWILRLEGYVSSPLLLSTLKSP